MTREGVNVNDQQAKLDRLRTFQVDIAKAWLARGRDSSDDVAKFLFFFSGFNALYFFAKLKSDAADRSELRDIERLVGLLTESESMSVLQRVPSQIEFFSQITIMRMDTRTLENPDDGDSTARYTA